MMYRALGMLSKLPLGWGLGDRVCADRQAGI